MPASLTSGQSLQLVFGAHGGGGQWGPEGGALREPEGVAERTQKSCNMCLSQVASPQGMAELVDVQDLHRLASSTLP